LCLRSSRPDEAGTHIVSPVLKGLVTTTVEISDELLREVRKLAAREGITLQTLVERGLRRVLAEAERPAPFKLRRASFNGKGLQAGLRVALWERLRDLTYQDRGV
jgi:hypothetical protein